MLRVFASLLFVLLVSSVPVGAAEQAASGVAVSTSDNHTKSMAGHPLAELLDGSGQLSLPEGFTGSIDPGGFDLLLDTTGSPRFRAKGASVDADARWDDRFYVGSGCDGPVRATAAGPDGALYLGGEFLSCGGVKASNIVRFDPATSTWSALGSGAGEGTNNGVLALEVLGNALYVGGMFSTVNVGADLPANNIARWDPDAGSWSTLGSGSGNGVNLPVLALAAAGTDLFVGGFFSSANVGQDIPVGHIARWDGASWSALGSGSGNGVNGPVGALAILGGDLFAGGNFTQANVGASIPANRIARWDGAAWSSLGQGGGNGVGNSVNALAVMGGDLYVGGFFKEANIGQNIAANAIARWDGSTWTALGSDGGNGVDFSSVRTLAVSGTDLYVGGLFSQANVGAPITANRVARWNGSTWQALGSGEGNGLANNAFSMTVLGNRLYVGGLFAWANAGEPVSANHVAAWNMEDGTWSALGADGGLGSVGGIAALAVMQGALYVGGAFTSVGGVAANRVARWDGKAWSALGSDGGQGVNGAVRALAVSGNALFVGGEFTEANQGNPISARNIAQWDGSDWSAVGSGSGNGVNAVVRALAAHGDGVYVGGGFTTANVGAPVAVNYIAYWNGSSWSALGSGGGRGVDSWVYALAVSGGDLYVGGDFSFANVGSHIPAYRIARWDGATWSALGSNGGNGVNAPVHALAVSGDLLYAGGEFTQANGGQFLQSGASAAIVANHVARWDGSTWSALGSDGGNGVNWVVNALAASDGELYVGGRFLEANVGAGGGGGIAAHRVARWSGGEWSALGSGVNDMVYSLAFLETGDLYLGGDFRYAGQHLSSFLARYVARGTLMVDLAGAGSGTVASDPAGLSCQDGCTGSFSWDQQIALTANPDATSVFAGWSGAGCEGTGACVIDFTQDLTVTANFDAGFTVGGTVSGLVGAGLVLRNNGGDPLQITAAGSFTFGSALPDLAPYEVSVLSQPQAPDQTCTVSNGSGVVSGADITDVQVDCSPVTYSVTAKAQGPGTISPQLQIVGHGEAAEFELEPAAQQRVVSVLGDTCTPVDAGDGIWLAAGIAANCAVVARFGPHATDLQVSKDAGVDTVMEGEMLVYAITVINAGPIAVSGAVLEDILPGGLSNAEWACLPESSSATCPPPPFDAGTGDLHVEIDLPLNGVLRYDLAARASALAGTLVANTATVATPDGMDDLEPANNSATASVLVVPDWVFVSGFEGESEAEHAASSEQQDQ